MGITTDDLFGSHPDPMWIYDLETLRFLEVNAAAVSKYGYSREEFLAMTIADIRPSDDRAALERNVAAVAEGRDEAGIWRHVLKSGDIIHVDITSHTLLHGGRRAELVAARDVSRLVSAEQAARDALAREQVARAASDALAQQFRVMFDAVPGLFLVFSPLTFDVVAVSDDALAAFGLARAAVVGRSLFSVLPDQPRDPAYSELRAAIDRVVAHGATESLSLRPRRAVAATGEGVSEERDLAAWVAPVAGPDGRAHHLMLRLHDVTPEAHPVRLEGLLERGSSHDAAGQDLAGLASALPQDHARLLDMARRLQRTQRLLATGTWTYATAEDRLDWSHAVHDMYGVEPSEAGRGFEDYLGLVHPEDRAALETDFASFLAGDETFFSFSHRIIRPDGQIIHVQGLGEKTEGATGPAVAGVVQNVTASVEAGRDLARAKRMLEIAGTSARFGAWHYDIASDTLHWSDETARIHDEPPGVSPDIEKGIRYYTPEHRDRIRAMLDRCLRTGAPFNDIFEIVTAKGRRLSVRATGEAQRDDSGAIVGVQGSFQDITELLAARSRAMESERLLALASQAASMGGWRVTLPDRKVSWTDGTAAIHELPPGTKPSFAGGVDYFAPEDQEDARRVFERCATEGVSFDNVRGLITAKGNRRTVRSIGVAVRDETGKIVAVQGAMQDISELTAARSQTEALARRLQDTLESISDAFMLMDHDWRYLYMNAKAEALIKRRREDLIGKVVWDEYPDAVGNVFHVQYLRAIAERRPVRFQAFSPTFGTWLSVNAYPTGEGLAIYFHDVTAERARDEQLRLLEAAIAHISDVVIITQAGEPALSTEARIVFVNEAFERLTGLSRDAAIGQTPRILQGPRTDRAELSRIREAIAACRPVQTELVNYARTGEEYWVELDIRPILSSDGTATHFVSVQRDITERRRAAEDLRLSETRFRLVAKATKNAIWDWDVGSNQLWWSEEMSLIFGHPTDPDRRIPSVWRANLHPDDADRVGHAMDRLLTGESDAINERYRFRKADGTWSTVEDRAFAIRNDAGQTVRVLGSMTDISERLQLEERLYQSQKLEAVGQLTGGVAHDFNNLLMIIMGNTEALQAELPPGDPRRRYVDMTATAVDRASELTNRLLAFSRKQALQPRLLDVNDVIGGIGAMLRRTLGEDIDFRLVPGAPALLTEADQAQFEAALLNLANNARDAMPDGGALTIETAGVDLDEEYVATEEDLKPGRYVQIAVSDTGHGIPPDMIGRVFEPFFTTKPVGKGTGLGLSMVYGFAKQTGGHVRVYSEVGQGTTFRLYFPRAADAAPVREVTRTPETLPRGAETILVVEDDAMILDQLRAQLTSLGYTVVCAAQGAEALETLGRRPDIALLFTDVVLPGGMNGRQIADAARLTRPDLKVLFTSGYSENAIVHHGRLDPGVELLSKPYRRAALAAKVRKVLDA